MDNSSLILGIVIAILIFIPTIYLATAGKRKLKKSLDRFISALKDQSIYINDYDQLGQYIIGMDTNAGTLVYKKGENAAEIIDMKDVSNVTNNIPAEGKRKNINNNLYIEVNTKESRNSGVSLEFYESTFSLDPGKEIKLIEKWTDKINSYLKNNK